MPLYEHIILARQDVTAQQVEELSTQYKDLIEKQCRGLLEFIESRLTLDDVIVHTFGDQKREGSGHHGALCHCTVRGSRSTEEHALPVAEMPHAVCAADTGKLAGTGIV